MKILFCDADGGEVLLEKDSKELLDIINSISRVGTEINLYFDKENFIHGYVDNIMYSYNGELNEQSLNLYISQDYNEVSFRTYKEISEIRKEIKDIHLDMN